MDVFGLVVPSSEFDEFASGKRLYDRVSFQGNFYKILVHGTWWDIRSRASLVPAASIARIEIKDTKIPGFSGRIMEILEIM